MIDKPKLQASDEHILKFVEHLKQVMSQITKPTSPQAMSVLEVTQGFESKDRLDPATFHRMGNLLYEKNDPTMGEISQALGVPLSTATRMANWWVERGYAQRLADPDDRRIVRLTLTDSGQQSLEALENHMRQTVQKVLSCLTDEERTILVTLAGKVAANLQSPET